MVDNGNSRDTLLELVGLSKYYGSVVAAEDVTLTIKHGEFISLLGPSGSGKTTILMMIAGFVTPSKGDLLLNGVSIKAKPPYQRNFGMVFQNYALFPHLNVFRNVAYPLEVRGLPKEKINALVKEALGWVRLQGFEHRMINQLSGGQQQRVALARAMVYGPKILLMDEPLGALDRQLRKHMQIEIKQLQRRFNLTVIYVTHDQEEALVMSDRIAIMNQGHLLQIDSPQQIYENPKSSFVAKFVGDSNILPGKLQREKEHLVFVADSGLKARVEFDSSLLHKDLSLSIRPEKIQVFRENHERCTTNTYKAVVKEVAYMGECINYLMQVTEEGVRDQSLQVKVSGEALASRVFGLGDKVKLGWNPGDGKLVE